MHIRTFRADDRAAVVALWHEVLPDDSPHNQPERVLDAKLAVDDMLYVAESGGRIVGTTMAGYDGHRGWLYSVAVSPAFQRSGVGGALVRHAVARLTDIGCAKVNLQVRAGNEAVVAFYRAVGFDTEARTSMGLRTGR